MKKEMIEKYLFYKFRNVPIKNKNDFRFKIKNYDVDADSLYLKINKYQVRKFGTSIYEWSKK